MGTRRVSHTTSDSVCRSGRSAGSRGSRWLLAALVAAVGMLLSFGPSGAHAEQPPDPPWVTGESNPSDLEIKLVTFGPGEAVPSWFGHAALVVDDTRRDHSRLYNYGMFNFGSQLLVKFATGRLWFWVGQQPADRTYRMYKSRDRDVNIHVLDLPPAKRQQVARYLAWNAGPEHREYLYHHYYDNCSTRPRDIVNAAVDGELREATSESSKLTLRQHTRRYTHHNFFMDLFLMFMMNDSIDQPIEQWDAMFLPGEMGEHVRELEYETPSGETRKLVREHTVYHEADDRPIPDEAPAHWHVALLLGVLVGAGAFVMAYWWCRNRVSTVRRVVFGLYNALVGTLLGVPGLGLFVMAIATDHRVTYWNENLYFANPLTFAAVPLGLMLAWGKLKSSEWLKWVWTGLVVTGLLGLALKVLPGFDQHNHLPISFIFPISIGFAAAWWWYAKGATQPEASGE